MAKKREVKFICNNCGEDYTKWSGRCENCGQWNSLVEFIEPTLSGVNPKSSAGKVLKFDLIEKIKTGIDDKRIQTNIEDVDLVLGGGLVLASVNLIAGEPGIGKSTLIMQIAAKVASTNKKVLYVSGEESAEQVASRAKRLGVGLNQDFIDNLAVVSSTSSDDIAATILDPKLKLDLVIVDSIQTLACAAVSSATGSISQVTNSTHILTQAAKAAGVTLIIVGHVTKDGSLAGPKILEHLVDVVLSLEGDRYGGFKVLRAVKNRYGSTAEAGIFEMGQNGLEQVLNPSKALLEERQAADGSVVFAAMEGNRPILVEVQALVNKTNFGYPKRAASGFDLNRLNLLIAVLNRRTKLNLSEHDVYINVVGGIKLSDPAADLAVAVAIASAAKGVSLKDDFAVAGEVGLSGEVRRVSNLEKRSREVSKMGFKGLIAPSAGSRLKILHEAKDLRGVLNEYLS